MSRKLRVTRGMGTKGSDWLHVKDASGTLLLSVSMGADSPLRPHMGDGINRPWFFTTSPFGAEILAFAKEVGVLG